MTEFVSWSTALFVTCGAVPGRTPPEENDALKVPITRQAVTSRHLKSVGYEEELKVLEIEFRTGAIYRYLHVPPSFYEALIAAGSKGQFFARNIRDRFEYREIHRPQR